MSTRFTPTASSGPARPRLADRLVRPFVAFMELEVSSAIVLLLMTVVALVWANSPWGATYQEFWHTEFEIRLGTVFDLEMSLGHWVNDGLMAIFFLVVGMEIKREMVEGELSTLTRAMLPVFAALGGMVVPAGIYLLFHAGEPTARGWGIPMATDIAFAVAALSLLGSRVPPPLRVFLLALAIADDLGAVSVIAIFYTEQIHLDSLGLAAAGLAVCYALNLIGVRNLLVYIFVGLFVWYETHHSGVHATIAGVMLGLLAPASRFHDDHESLVERGRHAVDQLRELLTGGSHHDHGGEKRHRVLVELQGVGRESLSTLDYLMNLLERWVAFFIMPVFALANAGVVIDTSTLQDPTAQSVAIAVALGLFVGKPLGVSLFSWAAVRMGIAELPRGANWGAVLATGVLAGIGFTVALFVTSLAFPAGDVAVAGSKIGILGGSLLATVAGLAILVRALPKEQPGS